MARKEKELDLLFEQRIKSSADFRGWLLNRTRFSGATAELVLCRADNPWYRGHYNGDVRESETDILLVFERGDTKPRFALHIENKIASPFTRNQPELYKVRARDWLNQSKWGNYQDYETILLAPLCYYKRNQVQAAHFDRFISHEELAEHISEFLPESALTA